MSWSIHRLAAEDLAQVARLYKKEAGAGLARRFLGEFERVAGLLEQYPGLGTPANEGRQVYPFVRHQHRAPAYGESRR